MTKVSMLVRASKTHVACQANRNTSADGVASYFRGAEAETFVV